MRKSFLSAAVALVFLSGCAAASAPVQSPAPSRTESPATPGSSPSGSPSPSSSAVETLKGFAPVWYPHWTRVGGRGAAEPWPSSWPRPKIVAPTGVGPLSGKVIVVDPGHNLGNSNHVADINKHYWVGLDKICNTTGTSTASGYPEASYTFDVAERLTAELAKAGATVVMSRDVNAVSTYGPCIQARGLLGEQVHADATVSIHADGGPRSGRGAFVYSPGLLAGYTDAGKAGASSRLAKSILAGLARNGLRGSTYLVPNVSPDVKQGGLNVAGVSIVIVETLNMQNPEDAAIAEDPSGRQHVADGLYAGVLGFF